MTGFPRPSTPLALFRRVAAGALFRHQIHHLESLDDHLLRDIGVERSSIRRAVRGLD